MEPPTCLNRRERRKAMLEDKRGSAQKTGTEVPENLPAIFAYLGKRAENIARVSDKLRDAVDKVETYLTNRHDGIAKLSGVPSSQEILLNPDDITSYAVVMGIRKFRFWELFWSDSYVFDDQAPLNSVSRGELILAVKALPEFLKSYAEDLRKAEAEVGDFAEKAERIAQILSPENEVK